MTALIPGTRSSNAQTGPGNCATNTIVGNNGGGLTCLTGGQAATIIGSTTATSVTNSDGTLTISPTTGAVVASLNSAHNFVLTGNETFGGTISLPGVAPVGGGPNCLQISVGGAVSQTGAACGSGSGAVNSVTNSDGTLTISPTTGAVVASINLAHANTWTGTITISGANLIGPSDNKFYSTDPSNYMQWNDRVFIGDASLHNNTGNVSCSGDWFSTFEGTTTNGSCGYIGFFHTVVETKSNNGNSLGALMGAGQTLNCGGNTCAAYGLGAFNVNNNNSFQTFGWGLYGECHYTSTKAAPRGGCTGTELEVRDTSVTEGVYPSALPQTLALQLGCGAGVADTGKHCGLAFFIGGNPQTFNVGLAITGITPNAGPTVAGTALTLAVELQADNYITWYSGTSLEGGIDVGSGGKMNLYAVNGLIIVDNASGAHQGKTCAAGTVNLANLQFQDGIMVAGSC